MRQFYTIFGQAYGAGAYSSCSYNNSCTTSSSNGTGSNAGPDNSTLTNTGFDIALFATIACVLIFAALVVRIWRHNNRQPVAEPVATDNDNQNNPDDYTVDHEQ